MRTELSFIFLAGAMTVTGSAWAVDYTAPGPEAFTTTDFANGTAGTLGGKLVVPNAPGKYPILVNTHGFSGNASQALGWGEHYASYGFIAVVPSIGGTDHKANGDVLKALADLYMNPATVSPAQGKVDATRLGMSGHSAGGLQTVFAAAQLKPQATVLFDPVDSGAIGKPVYATLCTPVMGMFADPGGCNVQAEWSTFKTTTVGPQVMLTIPGSNHCDPINPNIGPACDLFCGGTSSPANLANYSRYSTAYFLAMLKGDAAAAATLTASALAADTALKDTVVKDAPSCAGPADDAGVSTDASTDGPAPPKDVSSDNVSLDTTSSDTKADTTSTTDAPRVDATVDAPSSTDAPGKVDVSVPPADAGTTMPDSSTPTADSGTTTTGTAGTGGAGGATGTGGAGGTTGTPTTDSGCNCSLASTESQRSMSGAAVFLLGALVTGLRLRKRQTIA